MSTNKFSRKSLANLEGVDPRLIDLCHRVLLIHDCSVISGKRTEAEQAKKVAEGTSQTMKSKHLPSKKDGKAKAVDLAPYPIHWEDKRDFYFFAGIVMAVAEMMGIKIRWGGDWNMNQDLSDQQFFDLGHFELVED